MNDGIQTEIVSGDIKEGDELVTGTVAVAAAPGKNSGNAGSPFLPKPPQRPGAKKK